jgi:hypothetical protein
MSVNELAKMIGRTGFIYARGEMSVSVRIVDAKISYGAVRYLVEPIAGRGSTWVNLDTIELDVETTL